MKACRFSVVPPILLHLGLTLALACVFLSGGCRHLPTPAVWLPDSSGVVVGDQFFDLATKQTHRLEFPASFPEDDFRQVFVSAGTRSVIYTSLHLGDASHLLLEKAPLPPAQGEHMTTTLEVKNFDTHEIDLCSSPDGQAVVLCQLKSASIYHWGTQKHIALPAGIMGPYAFERVFGISPCRPDGAGFLAMTAAKGKGVVDQTSALKFVRWDGSVQPLAGAEEFRAAFSMLMPPGGDGHGPIPFMGTAAWKGNVVTLAFCGDQLDIDTEALRVKFVRRPEEPDPKRGARGLLEIQKQIQANGGAAVPCGQVVIETRPHGAFRLHPSSALGTCGEQLVVRDPATGNERVVDFHKDYPISRFRLIPSPDGRQVLAQLLTGGPEKARSLLFDGRGEVVTTLGLTPEEWRWNVLDRRIGLPYDTEHDVFGKGYSVRLHSKDFEGEFLDLLKAGDGPFAMAREAAYVEVDEIDKAAVGDALQVIGKFPALRFLYCPPSDEAADGLASVPHLEGLTGPLTDRFLDRLPALEKLQVFDFHKETRLSRQGALALRRHPTLHWLNLYGSTMTEPFLEGLAELPSLRTMYVRDHVESLKGLGHVSNLRKLSIRGASISETDLPEIGRLTRLETLVLWGLHRDADSLEALRGLRSLKRLELCRATGFGKPTTSLPPLPLEPLIGMTELENLELCGAPVEDEDLSVLEGLKKLKAVSLRTPKCSEQALRRLSKSLPLATISVLSVNERKPARTIYRNGESSDAKTNPPGDGNANSDGAR